MALPIDRDISRVAYTKAGKIPNELRKMFQVLRPGRSKRGAIFALGAVLGGVVGVALTYGGQMLFGQPGTRVAAPPPEPVNAQSPPTTAATPLAPPVAAPTQRSPVRPELTLPDRAAPGPSVSAQSTSPPPALTTFSISSRGLEASVKAELERRGLDKAAWQETYGQVISLNMNTLCSPEKWRAAEAAGRKPLDVIGAETQLTWPTEIDFQKPSRLRECPVYAIPT